MVRKMPSRKTLVSAAAASRTDTLLDVNLDSSASVYDLRNENMTSAALSRTETLMEAPNANGADLSGERQAKDKVATPSTMELRLKAVQQQEGKNGGEEEIVYGANLAAMPTARKAGLMVFLCLCQFLDAYATSALFSAIPPISVALGISNDNSVWLLSGYQLTFASLLLLVSESPFGS